MYHDKKLVEIWLTKAEKDNPQVAEELKPVYREYAEKKYTVAVFKSGMEDLWDETSALLKYNREHMAQLEVQEKREPQMELSM